MVFVTLEIQKIAHFFQLFLSFLLKICCLLLYLSFFFFVFICRLFALTFLSHFEKFGSGFLYKLRILEKPHQKQRIQEAMPQKVTRQQYFFMVSIFITQNAEMCKAITWKGNWFPSSRNLRQDLYDKMQLDIAVLISDI